MGRYDGKRVVITGGTAGIGLATATMLIDEGARVLITGRNPDTLRSAAEALGDRAVPVVSDASSLPDIEALADRVRTEFGEIDLLFLNAGTTRWTPFDQVDEAQYDAIFAVNTKGPFFLVQRLAPLLPDGSAVVLTTSVVDVMGYPMVSVYAASKAALRSLTRSLARELLPRGVRVNAVSPGVIDTDILAKAESPAVSEQAKRQTAQSNPMKRIGRPEELARAVLFLGFEATYTTGFEIPVDGGSTQL